MKTFIAISSEIQDGKVIYLNTSLPNKDLFQPNGITPLQAIEFLFNLVYERTRKTGVVFVCYAFARDNEFLFSALDNSRKDRLFQSEFNKREVVKLEDELIELDYLYYNSDEQSQDYQSVDFERYVNRQRLKDLSEIEINGYILTLANGKFLTIRKGKKSISIYDIYGFFKGKSLAETAKKWLGEAHLFLDKENLSALDTFGLDKVRKLKIHSKVEVETIAALAAKLETELNKIDIKLSRYHGASAITSNFLSKHKAKQYFNSYKNKYQLSSELNKAVHQSFYSGRSEQHKLGTIQDVKIYDINSAYAFSCLSLLCMLSKPFFVNAYDSAKEFSLWYCEYDFSKCNLYFGLLPNRTINGFVQYKLKGKGYFWSPEIKFVLENFPNCIKIKHGFVLDSKPLPFANEIQNLYNIRLELQAANNPLEKIIKLALASLYGKFCQRQGKSYYYNLFYAGYITSKTRSMLLEATKGYEKETICFQTDAIHTTAFLPVNLSCNLGEYKLSTYSKVIYLDNGVYQCFDNKSNVIKQKSRGFASFDFRRAYVSIKETYSYNAIADIFVGYNLSSRNDLFTEKLVDYLATIQNKNLTYKERMKYLEYYSFDKKMQPLDENNNAMRIFENKQIDLTETFIDSKPLSNYNGIESALYRENSYSVKDIALTSYEANRI